MKLDNVFKKTRLSSARKSYIALNHRGPEVPEGLLRKCNKCGGAIIAEDVKKGYYICPKCGGYFRVHAYRRIEMVGDEGTSRNGTKVFVPVTRSTTKATKKKSHIFRRKPDLRKLWSPGK